MERGYTMYLLMKVRPSIAAREVDETRHLPRCIAYLHKAESAKMPHHRNVNGLHEEPISVTGNHKFSFGFDMFHSISFHFY